MKGKDKKEPNTYQERRESNGWKKGWEIQSIYYFKYHEKSALLRG